MYAVSAIRCGIFTKNTYTTLRARPEQRKRPCSSVLTVSQEVSCSATLFAIWDSPAFLGAVYEIGWSISRWTLDGIYSRTLISRNFEVSLSGLSTENYVRKICGRDSKSTEIVNVSSRIRSSECSLRRHNLRKRDCWWSHVKFERLTCLADEPNRVCLPFSLYLSHIANPSFGNMDYLLPQNQRRGRSSSNVAVAFIDIFSGK